MEIQILFCWSLFQPIRFELYDSINKIAVSVLDGTTEMTKNVC